MDYNLNKIKLKKEVRNMKLIRNILLGCLTVGVAFYLLVFVTAWL